MQGKEVVFLWVPGYAGNELADASAGQETHQLCDCACAGPTNDALRMVHKAIFETWQSQWLEISSNNLPFNGHRNTLSVLMTDGMVGGGCPSTVEDGLRLSHQLPSPAG